MSVLSLLLNIAWILCGGLEMAFGWLVAAVIMAITIIGIPWAKAAFNIAFYTLLPLARKRFHAPTIPARRTSAPGPLAFWETSCGWCSRDGGWRSATSSWLSCWP